MQTYNLSFATRKDVDIIFRLTKQFLDESSYNILPLDDNKIVYHIVEGIESNEKDIILCKCGEKTVGFVACQLTENFFTHELVASEVIWYVLPECRRSSVSLRLFIAFEQWSKRMGAEFVTTTSLASTDKGVDAFYERRGYHPVEKCFMKRLTLNEDI